jgi:hypothetical protein
VFITELRCAYTVERLYEMTDGNSDIIQAKSKANMLYARLLEFVRHGDTIAIKTSLSSSDYPGLTGLMLRGDPDFAMTVMQFLSPQIVRAAIDGGMGELAAADTYLEYMQCAKTAKTSAVGTRRYYLNLGFENHGLYQQMLLM